MTTKPQITTRVLPPKFRNSIDCDFHLRLTRWERIKVLFGYTIDLHYQGLCEHSPAKMQHTMTHAVVNKF